ncbi:MAG: hypothetical protein NT128_06340 [Proteobacteria bacterium]|nr:hypothetical protein [Pseudomonadota bacterium]
MSNIVVLRTFLYRHEAELAKVALETRGIYSIVSADDLGGMRQHLSFGSVTLSVFEFDLDNAKKILKPLG